MKTCVSDTFIFYRKLGKVLISLFATYVDDKLHAGNQEYSQLCKKTAKKFNCKVREYDYLQFSGLEIDTGKIAIHLKLYISTVRKIPQDATYTNLRSLRVKLSCITNSRPQIACQVAKLVKDVEQTFEKSRRHYTIRAPIL